jgi:hypothetical protein
MTKNNITFFDKYFPEGIIILIDPYIHILDKINTQGVEDFMYRLDEDKVYIVTLEFIHSFLLYDAHCPSIVLSRPILVDKNSNPEVIIDFITKRIDYFHQNYYWDDSLLTELEEGSNKNNGPGILLRYKEVNFKFLK